VNITTPTEQLSWLIEIAEMKKKESQFGTLQTILAEIEAELYNNEGELDDQVYCEVAFYLAKSFEDLGYIGKAQELYEQASLFAPDLAHIEEKALIQEVRLKSFLRMKEELEPSYVYLKALNFETNFEFLTAMGFAELAFGRHEASVPYFEKALNLSSASKQDKKKLFFQLLEQELFYGHNFSKIVKLSDLGMFDELSAYEQTLVFVLSHDMQALSFLGSIWFQRMNPAESLKASFLLSHIKKFTLGWCYKPLFFQNLSQFDFQTQTMWKRFFENSNRKLAS
jgi:tetratricopeptide (TPR) repeat protein